MHATIVALGAWREVNFWTNLPVEELGSSNGPVSVALTNFMARITSKSSRTMAPGSGESSSSRRPSLGRSLLEALAGVVPEPKPGPTAYQPARKAMNGSASAGRRR